MISNTDVTNVAVTQSRRTLSERSEATEELLCANGLEGADGGRSWIGTWR